MRRRRETEKKLSKEQQTRHFRIGNENMKEEEEVEGRKSLFELFQLPYYAY